MWELELPDHPIKVLTCGSIFKLGRDPSNDYQSKDPTVSRKHCFVEIKENLECFFHNLSNYGSLVNDKMVKSINKLEEDSENEITLGKQQPNKASPKVILVRFKKVAICPSFVSVNESDRLNVLCNKFHFQIVDQIIDSTHLIMSKIGVTTKFLNALIEAKQIISLQWLENLLKLKSSFKSPKEKKCFPTITDPHLLKCFSKEELVNNLKKNRRKSLFQKTTFLYLSHQIYKTSSKITKKAGANENVLIDIDEKKAHKKMKNWFFSFMKKNQELDQNLVLCVIDPRKPGNCKWKEILNTFNIEMITEINIGLAVVSNSVDVYCNPRQPSLNNEKIQINPNNLFEKDNMNNKENGNEKNNDNDSDNDNDNDSDGDNKNENENENKSSVEKMDNNQNKFKKNNITNKIDSNPDIDMDMDIDIDIDIDSDDNNEIVNESKCNQNLQSKSSKKKLLNKEIFVENNQNKTKFDSIQDIYTNERKRVFNSEGFLEKEINIESENDLQFDELIDSEIGEEEIINKKKNQVIINKKESFEKKDYLEKKRRINQINPKNEQEIGNDGDSIDSLFVRKLNKKKKRKKFKKKK
ncbi:nibrin-related [Anaeramoeba flamelloides]|uniref:Nibrin-related n=1 Tax=Anaeramoeba flamelloides TaxID=1746091 RepID=A0ABQ8Z2I0_9EUKA|nr:nibrin-related [Anaeramoeba flamelloides]